MNWPVTYGIVHRAVQFYFRLPVQRRRNPHQIGNHQINQGQIFVPGLITYNSQGVVTGGTPICGTAAAPCKDNSGGIRPISAIKPGMGELLETGLPGLHQSRTGSRNNGRFWPRLCSV